MIDRLSWLLRQRLINRLTWKRPQCLEFFIGWLLWLSNLSRSDRLHWNAFSFNIRVKDKPSRTPISRTDIKRNDISLSFTYNSAIPVIGTSRRIPLIMLKARTFSLKVNRNIGMDTGIWVNVNSRTCDRNIFTIKILDVLNRSFISI